MTGVKQFWEDVWSPDNEIVSRDRKKAHQAAKRLNVPYGSISVHEFNAMLMNRIADLEERLEAYEKAQHQSPQDALGRPDPDGGDQA